MKTTIIQRSQEGDTKSKDYSNPLVSIITVSLNSEKTIERTILSVKNQTYKNIEYIIIDGGSTDSTSEIINKYKKNISYWVSEKDAGIYNAMNKGISIANGEIIGIINSDDWLKEDAIEKVIATSESLSDEKYVIHGKIAIFDKNNRFMKNHGPKPILGYHYISTPFKHPAMFVSRKIYDDIGVYDEEIGLSADYDFMLRVIRHHCPTYYIDSVLTNMQKIGISSGGYAHGPFSKRIKILRRHTGSIAISFLICTLRSAYKFMRKYII